MSITSVPDGWGADAGMAAGITSRSPSSASNLLNQTWGGVKKIFTTLLAVPADEFEELDQHDDGWGLRQGEGRQGLRRGGGSHLAKVVVQRRGSPGGNPPPIPALHGLVLGEKRVF